MTLDQLIESLQSLKADGLDGSTVVGIPTLDNNGKWGMVQLEIAPRITAIAKDEHAKGWTICRNVSRGGVPVLVIAG